MNRKLLCDLRDALKSRRDTVDHMRMNALEEGDDKRVAQFEAVVNTLAEIIDALEEILEHSDA